MSATPSEHPPGGVAPNGLVRFTRRGEEALDALAADLTARCDSTPEGIAQLLEQVLHADLNELASALTVIAGPTEDPANDPAEDQALSVDADLAQAPATPDEAAQRRQRRNQDLQRAIGTAPTRSFDR